MMPHLVIMAAGTGGHIIPGIAVARELQRRGWSVSWLGTTTGMENRLVPPTGIALDRLAFSGMRGKGLLHSLGGGLRLIRAFWDAAAVLRRRGASAVLGMGGYVCLPGGLMASLLRKPLLLVNADAALLLSNKVLLRFADRVAFGFEGPAAAVRQGLVTGNPVRAEIEALPAPAERFAGRSGPLQLLVVGGSLGAQVLNQTLPAALALLPAEQRPRVVHQTGTQQLDAVRAAYALHGVEAEVLPFIDDTAGVPSLLVPLVLSTTAHQRDNAEYMAGHGAALHWPQSGLTAESLSAQLHTLSREVLLAMANKARALARPHAAARVADELERLVSKP